MPPEARIFGVKLGPLAPPPLAREPANIILTPCRPFLILFSCAYCVVVGWRSARFHNNNLRNGQARSYTTATRLNESFSNVPLNPMLCCQMAPLSAPVAGQTDDDLAVASADQVIAWISMQPAESVCSSLLTILDGQFGPTSHAPSHVPHGPQPCQPAQ